MAFEGASMHWTYLGHAGWLARVGELRLLFDPLIYPMHYGDVFESVPSRQLVVEALRPDFMFLSHAHADHTDAASLVALARQDPDIVVMSPDPWVCELSARAGFHQVQSLAAGQRAELQGTTVIASPSRAPDPECGFYVANAGAAVWNLVDCVYRGPEEVADIAAAAAMEAGSSSLALSLVRWQPLKEVDAVLGNALGFPFAAYEDLLAEAVATGASTLMASSSGARHGPRYAYMNELVYPVEPSRFQRDLSQRAEPRQVMMPRLGEMFEVRVEGVRSAGIADELLMAVGDEEPPRFRPCALPPLRADAPRSVASETRVRAWVDAALIPGLAHLGIRHSLLLVLEVVTRAEPLTFVLEVGPNGVRHSGRSASEYDLLNQVPLEGLLAVLDGEECWGQLLLSGRLRAAHRAYVQGPPLATIDLLPTFVYAGLSYEDSERRATLRRLAQALASVDGA
ncbi:MAG: MBL fold metallo-hydrolase [Polyangiaceae bacterium]